MGEGYNQLITQNSKEDGMNSQTTQNKERSSFLGIQSHKPTTIHYLDMLKATFTCHGGLYGNAQSISK
jgi:hypothetical protein